VNGPIDGGSGPIGGDIWSGFSWPNY
jgi:hypothetical protein